MEKNDDRAFAYYEKAAKQGYALAQYNTGINYREGRGCQQDYSLAVEWFERAAAQGDSYALVALGRLYFQGLGVPRNERRAVEMYERSADQGNHVAQVQNLHASRSLCHTIPYLP